MRSLPLPLRTQAILFIVSWGIMAFGQPAWFGWLGLVGAVIGLALFWRVLLCHEPWRRRLLIAISWYAVITAVHFSWASSHPYTYIYGVTAGFCLLGGLQFGLFCLLITPERLKQPFFVLLGAAVWTLCEWSRLFFMSGYTWNPFGLLLTGSIYPLQTASLWGIFGLTFWVTAVNLLVLRTWLYPSSWMAKGALASMVLFPYLFGVAHIAYHESANLRQGPPRTLTAVLVQPYSPVENQGAFSTPERAVSYVLGQWQHILQLAARYRGEKVDMVVLPEYMVPFGTYWTVYPLQAVKNLFVATLGPDSLSTLPDLEAPDAQPIDTPSGKGWYVSNAYLAQAVANAFHAGVVVGLQDDDEMDDGSINVYSAAFHFCPGGAERCRYEKQVLVPMGEYIPFSLVRDLAARYGILASFTPGAGAKVFKCDETPFGISICYEETFGHLMRENRSLGADLLVNVTNDGWYPNSRLSQQHFDHARARTVEMGIPLIRSANTGVTGAIDSLGRVVAVLEKEQAPLIDGPGAIKVEVPLYHYSTLYTHLGDGLAVVLSLLIIGLAFKKWA